MAILAPLLAFVGRFVGKFLNMAFSWASVMLLARVPASKQLLLSGVRSVPAWESASPERMESGKTKADAST